jgi:hypothetical protein
MKLDVMKLGVQLTGLLGIAAATLVQRLGGADYPPVPPKTIIALVAAAFVVARHRQAGPVGTFVAGALGFGAIVMPNAADQLSNPDNAQVFYATIAELVSIAVALAGGVALLIGRKDQGKTATPAANKRP